MLLKSLKSECLGRFDGMRREADGEATAGKNAYSPGRRDQIPVNCRAEALGGKIMPTVVPRPGVLSMLTVP